MGHKAPRPPFLLKGGDCLLALCEQLAAFVVSASVVSFLRVKLFYFYVFDGGKYTIYGLFGIKKSFNFTQKTPPIAVKNADEWRLIW